MKDYLGNDIEVGDIVVTQFDHYRSLRKALVVKLTPTGMKVVFFSRDGVAGKSEFFKQPAQVCYVGGTSREKNLWEQGDKPITANMVLDAPLPYLGHEVTIRSFFTNCAMKLWDEGESFNGKRPFGDSGWEGHIYAAMAYLGVADRSDARKIVRAALATLRGS
jgi:hypothetical protein